MTVAEAGGLARQIGPWVAVGAILLPLLGYVYTTGRAINDVRGRLDRNCRILATVQANTRFIIVTHAGRRSEANAFREIFERALVESC